MGQWPTKPTNENDDANMHTPKTPFKLANMFDPRSPTVEYNRTPILLNRKSKHGGSIVDSVESRASACEEQPADFPEGVQVAQKEESELIKEEDSIAIKKKPTVEVLTALLTLLKPEMTITGTLADIQKKKTHLTAAEERKLRWAAKMAGKPVEQTDEQKDTAKLKALADELISAGHMDAYEWTRERIEQMLKKMDSTATDSLDMFSDEPAAGSSSSTPAAADSTADDEVKWEYKESETAEITGPFTSAEMAARREKEELGAEGLARKIGSGGFNPVAGIDFELF